MDNLIQKLKAIKNRQANPSNEWLNKNREFLLSQISNTVSKESKEKFHFSTDKMWKFMTVFLPRPVVYGIFRPVAIILMVLSVGTSGWIATVAASQNTVPGDALHSTKILTEKVHIAVLDAIDAKETKTKTSVVYAKRRAEETKKLVESPDPSKIKEVPISVKALKEEIKKVEANLKEVKDDTGVKADAVKEVGKSTTEIGTILKDVEKDLASKTSSTVEIKADLNEIKKINNDTSIKVVEVIVDKHLKGDQSITKDEVKVVIEEKVKELSGATQANNLVVQKVKVETKKVVDDNSDLITSSTVSSSTVTASRGEEQKLEDANKQTKEAATKIEAAVKQVDNKMQETNNLLQIGDLKNAVKAVVEASKTASEAQDTKDKTIQTIEEISPIFASTVLLEVEKQVISSSTQKMGTSTTANVEIKASSTIRQ